MKSLKMETLVLPIPDRAEARIKKNVYTVIAPLQTVAFRTDEPVPYAKKESGERLELKPGDCWGKLFDCAWFHFTGRVPGEAAGKKVVLILDVSGEGCIYDNDGNPVRGISSRNVYWPNADCTLKRVVPFAEKARGGEEIDIWADCGYNDLLGNSDWGIVKNRSVEPFKQADIALCDDNVRDLYYDYRTLNNLRKGLSDKDPRFYSILYALIEADRVLKTFSAEEVEKAKALLKAELDKKGGTPSLEFSAVGHAHLDLAWLWPIRETKRKATRTFSTQLALMEKYPDYIFAASQPQQWLWIKEQHPGLYRRMKDAVKAGRLEPLGCMWVEPDTNVPCGESLVRQILYGKKFFFEEFGKDIDVLWLPDVFGFSAALPQLCIKSGVKYLATIKLSWNKFTKFPYHTFRWKGLSDDEIIVHMPPNGDYNSAAQPCDFICASDNYTEKGKIQYAFMSFGVGDGGAGPSPMHLETLSRTKNLAGMPPVRIESSTDFFHRLDSQTEKMPGYRGDIYLQVHQGTYTTQSKNKFYNRRMELLLHDMELLYSAAGLLKGATYPKAEIDRIWQEVLLYQFHDILPGSSIKRVYDETTQAYEVMQKKVLGFIEKVAGGETKNAVFNPLGFQVRDFIENNGNYYEVTAAPLGCSLLSNAKEVKKFSVSANENSISNGVFTAEFAGDGRLVSFAHIGGRNAVTNRGGNLLNVYEDRGEIYNGDAWDMDTEYFMSEPATFRIEEVKTYCEGPYAVREQRFTYNNSTLIQKILLKEGHEYLEFENTVDWQEHKKMLRAEFFADANGGHVRCGVQFGSVQRATTCNSLEEEAQFEICAQRYVQQSEGCFHVAVLSDCKYGYRAKENLISLDLLRAPEYPTTEFMGEHTFRYALYTCQGESDVERQSYLFQNGLRTIFSHEEYSLAKADCSNIMIETVKPAEDGNGYVMRVYENKGEKTAAKLTINGAFKKAYLCDMMENSRNELMIEKGNIGIVFHPYEIHTFRFIG